MLIFSDYYYGRINEVYFKEITMKKLLFLMMSFLAVSGCVKNNSSYKNGPDAAYYSEWDRAVRYDAKHVCQRAAEIGKTDRYVYVYGAGS